MADSLIGLSAELHIDPVLAHLNHQLRGESANEDARYVCEFASSRGVRCIVGQTDVASLARDRRLSVEVAARQARYDFLVSAARSCSASYIALAHNSDDQVETVLLRILRGTGIHGLRGMRPVSPYRDALPCEYPTLQFLRPLLGVSREQIECYCRERQLDPRHDATNDDLHYTRNRIRHELLPLLEKYNPGIRKVLARLADTAASDDQIIQYATKQAVAELLVDPSAHSYVLNRDKWRALPAGLQRAVLREGILRLKHNIVDLKYSGVEEAREVLNSDAHTAEIAILSDVRIIVHPHTFEIVLLTL
jgi:tRNA(Ile)-lysidine synthase